MKIWSRIIDLTTISWVVVFVLSMSGFDLPLTGFFSGLIGGVYVVDLVVIFRRSPTWRDFLKKAWLDILLLIPFLRFLRTGKLARVISRKRRLARLFKSRLLDNGIEGVDLFQKGIERVRFHWF